MTDTRYGVAVVGGGLAGVAAALAAAEVGAQTLLIEREDALGGNVAQAWVHTLCGLYHIDRDEPAPVNHGIPVRFARMLTARKAARAVERAGRVHVLPIIPEAVSRVSAELCRATPNLDVSLNTRLEAAWLSRDASERSTLSLAQRNGLGKVCASVVIDASGDANLSALGGAELLPPYRGVQACSYIVRLAGVAPSIVQGFAPLQLTAQIAGAARASELLAGCESVLVRPAQQPDSIYLTLNIAPPDGSVHDPLNPAYVQELHRLACRRVDLVLEYVKATRSEFAQAFVAGRARAIGIRETRRIAGQHVITEHEIANANTGPDDVAASAWPMEVWQDHRRVRFHYPRGASGVPVGALRSRSHSELGMAGRCVSATQEALGALRVLGTCMAMGQAIGSAAGLAAQRHVSLRSIQAEEIREVIKHSATEHAA